MSGRYSSDHRHWLLSFTLFGPYDTSNLGQKYTTLVHKKKFPFSPPWIIRWPRKKKLERPCSRERIFLKKIICCSVSKSKMGLLSGPQLMSIIYRLTLLPIFFSFKSKGKSVIRKQNVLSRTSQSYRSVFTSVQHICLLLPRPSLSPPFQIKF